MNGIELSQLSTPDLCVLLSSLVCAVNCERPAGPLS